MSSPPAAVRRSSVDQPTGRFTVPPSLYTQYYCEENIYLLVRALELHQDVRATWACFVSNPERRALLFNQKASRQGADQGSYVIWDYHVFAIAAVRQRDAEDRVVVLDLDSKLGRVVDLSDYVERTFYPSLFRHNVVDPSLASRIRIVPGQDFLRNFASDRSHMLAVDNMGELAYVHPPPAYPPICGPGAPEPHNLWSRFLDMGQAQADQDMTGYGIVLVGPEDLLRHDFHTPKEEGCSK
ncbi:hypothetical protein JCM11491_004916 [Sporobolomyces phaffii]